jgi:RNA polymerase sigma factor (sigma-70 family)
MTGPSRANLRASTMDRSFGELYRVEFSYVWTNLRRLGVPPMSLEDAVHDVFVVVYRRLPSFEGRSSLRTWLFGIVRRVASRHRRTEARTQRRRAALALVVPEEHDLDDAMARSEAARALEVFLDRLDPRKREAFVLGELERLTREQLGQALGVSPNTAYSRLRAARAEFRRTFAEASPRARERVRRVARSLDPAPPQTRKRTWLLLATEIGTRGTWTAVVTGATSSAGKLIAIAGAVALVSWIGATELASPRRDPDAAPTRPAVSSPGSSAVAAIDGVEPLAPAQPSEQLDTPAASPNRPSRAPLRKAHVPVQSEPDPSEPTESPAEATVAQEAGLLQRARAALQAGDGRTAIAHLDDHAARFPSGALSEEREASRVDALCATGDPDGARAAAGRFARRYPRSAHLERLRTACTIAINSPASGD